MFQSDVLLYVNRLNTEERVMPYEYSYFDFCLSPDDDSSPAENLGQVVFGERIKTSPYKISFMENQTCTRACEKTYKAGNPDSEYKLKTLRNGIIFNYQHHWIVDNMPVTNCRLDTDLKSQVCTTGFPMGCYVKNGRNTCSMKLDRGDAYYINNHVDLTITYHSGGKEEWASKFHEDSGRIISVKVTPRSINHGR